MKRMKSFMLLFSVFAISLVTIISQTPSAAATFMAGNIIDDSHFENVNSMTAAQIDSLLNSYPSSCISTNSGFSTPDPQGWSDAQNRYTFGGNVSGGQAIYDVAHIYQVNPQVILTTLQKEQSVVTGSKGCHYDKPNPADSSQLYTCTIGGSSTTCTDACPYAYGGGCMNIAMSYGCPGSCKAADEGFSLQLTLGTWILRFGERRAYGNLTGYTGHETGDEYFCYSGPMTAGTRQRSASSNPCPTGSSPAGNTPISYDGTYVPGDSSTITISNGATATLYNYTPFVSGNQSFYNLWTSTFNFGPTTGDLFSSPGGGVYKIESGTKRAFPNEYTFLSYSYNWSDVTSVSSSELAQIPDGADMPYNVHHWDGRLVKSSSGGVYDIDNGTKRPFPNDITFTSYSFKWSDAVTLTNTELSQIPDGAAMPYNVHYRDGRLVKSSSGGVYDIDNGTKRPFPSTSTFLSYGYKWTDVLTISDWELSQIPDGAAMPPKS